MGEINVFFVITLVLNLLVLYHVVIGFLLGLKRGALNSFIRLITLVFSAFLAYFLVTKISFGGVNILQGLKNLVNNKEFNEFLNPILQAENSEQIANFAVSLIFMILGGLTFSLLYFLIKAVTFIIFKILAKLFDKIIIKKGFLFRILGGVLGVVCGIFSVFAITVPVNGYLQSVNKVSQTVQTVSGEPFINTDTLSNVNKSYNDTVWAKVSNALGVSNFEILVFNGVTSTTYNNLKISLCEQVDNLDELYGAVYSLSNCDFNEVLNNTNGEQRQVFIDNLLEILNNSLLKAGVDLIVPLIDNFGNDIIKLENPELIQPLKQVLKEVATAINLLPEEQIKQGLNSVFDAVSNISAYKNPETDAQNLISAGQNIDDILSLNFISQNSVTDLLNFAVDEVFKNQNLQKYENIKQSLKNGINSGIQSYKTELTAISKLISVTSVIGGDFSIKNDAERVGELLDESVAVGGKIITQSLVNGVIGDFLNDLSNSVEQDSALFNCLKTIKQNFETATDLVYKTEFCALAKLYSATDILENFNYKTQAHSLGKIIDDTLAVNAKLINKQLLNSFIKEQVIDLVQIDGAFGETVNRAVERLNLQISYEQEFAYVEKLITISENVTEFSIKNVTEKQIWAGETQGKNIGERLDEIAPSVLFGDCGIYFIDSVLNQYKNDNVKFESIFNEIYSNYQNVSQNARVCGETSGYTYNQITTSLANVYYALTDSVNKITEQPEFSKELAQKYEQTLDSLQNEIIVSNNGAKAIASFIAGEVKQIILNYKSGIAVIDEKIDVVANYVQNYKNYLTGVKNDGNNQPYRSDTNAYITSLSSDFSGNYTAHQTQPSGDYIKINKPFSTVFEQLEQALGV